MNLRPSSFLGLSVQDRSIVCAEVSLAGSKRMVRRLASFALADDMSFDKPAGVGEAFITFLRQHKFSASRAVIGIPAKWMIALEKEIPPSGEEQARAMLRLQSERLGVSESGEMVFDYAGKSDSVRANKVLLVGVKRQRLEQIEDMLDAAGISVVAITSSALALAGGTRNIDQDVPMLLLGRQGAEMVWRHDGTPKMLRHVSVLAVNGHGPVTLNSLGSELGRTLALTRSTGTTTARELVLWDGIGLSSDQVAELADRSGVKVRSGQVLTSLGLEEAPGARLTNGQEEKAGHVVEEMYAPALSLALAGADRSLLPLDFTKSRLTPKRARRVGRQGVWAIVAGSVVVLAIAALYVSVYVRNSELKALQKTLDDNKNKYADANRMIDRFNYTRTYFETRPPYLDCLAELSKEFPVGERIWITSVTIRDEDRRADNKGPQIRKGTLQGRAADDREIVNLVKKLKANKKFSEVGTQLSWTDAGQKNASGKKTGELNFTMSFNYIAQE
jgi:hypothetical protein